MEQRNSRDRLKPDASRNPDGLPVGFFLPRGSGLFLHAPGGVLIFSEPALRDTARRLQRLRDTLSAAGAGRVLLPCTHAEPCPLLPLEEHWCHESRVWPLPPPRLRRLASATGLRRRDILFSPLVLQRANDAPLAARYAMDYRVVGAKGRLKGRTERWLCGATGLRQARCLARNLSDENNAFFTSQRGELLRIEGATEPKAGHLELGAKSRAEARDPAHDALSSPSTDE